MADNDEHTTPTGKIIKDSIALAGNVANATLSMASVGFGLAALQGRIPLDRLHTIAGIVGLNAAGVVLNGAGRAVNYAATKLSQVDAIHRLNYATDSLKRWNGIEVG